MTDRIARLHAWMKAHKAYFWGVVAIFPELWVSSTDLQAMLPAPLVSRIASAIALISFGIRLRASLQAAKLKSDDTDQAGA